MQVDKTVPAVLNTCLLLCYILESVLLRNTMKLSGRNIHYALTETISSLNQPQISSKYDDQS